MSENDLTAIKKFPEIKILFVDDDVITQKLIGHFLDDWNFSFASSGDEALEMMEKETYSIVLLDYKMPGMDGLTLLKEIRKRFSMIQTIMMTSSNEVDVLFSSLELGATDFIQKPVDKETLVRIVKSNAEKAVRWQETLKNLMNN